MWSPVMSRILSRSNAGAIWFFHKSWYISHIFSFIFFYKIPFKVLRPKFA